MDLIENMRVFKRVAERQSFSAVAAEFNVTQPTISKAVAALEHFMGVSLFRRSTRGLKLTPEGQKLLYAGGSVLDQVDQMIASVRDEKHTLRGPLRVTASLGFSRLVLAPLFEPFLKTHPEIKFQFVLSDGFIDLVQNNVDLALRIGDLPNSGLRAIKIGLSRRNFYAAKKYVKKFGSPRDLRQLKEHRLMFYTRLGDQSAYPLVNENGKRIHFGFEPYFQSDGSDLIREAVLQGVGIAYLPTWMMMDHEDLVIQALQPYVSPPSPIYLLTTGNQNLGGKQKAFAEFLRAEFDQMTAISLRDPN